MRRIRTKIGDIFSAEIDENSKRYFQYVANDLSQLNSDVIRAYKRKYRIDETPGIADIVNDEIDFYAHCVVDLGIKMQVWQKIGNEPLKGDIDVTFRGTNDYGTKPGKEPVKVSNNWYVWKINERFIDIGKLEGAYKEAFIGLVINPQGIIELLKGNKYPPYYPE